MARAKKFRWSAAALAVMFIIGALVLWITPSRQTSSAQDGARAAGPLIARGYTDAPAGTVSIGGDPAGGAIILELRAVEGQKVKRDDILAVMSNYPKSAVAVRSAEAELAKAKEQRKAMVSGYRVGEIAEQEVAVKSSTEESKLKVLEMQRSGKPPDVRQLEVNISQWNLEREQAKLRVKKETLQSDLAQIDSDIGVITARLDNARTTAEESLVRSPIDGVVVQIYARQGERVPSPGIVEDRRHDPAARIGGRRRAAPRPRRPGGKVEVTFRGSPTVYKGKISRVAPT